MAMQEGSPSPGPTAQVVGNAFVQQYYHILHQSPELVHRFYQDSSFLSRPNANGDMTTVTTMQAINEKILSLNYEDYTVEIETADAQESYEKGVIVVVTGCLTRKDNVRKKFTQTFFLAPQDKGYFVFNDIFRYIGENDLHINSLPANGITENTSASAPAPEPEPIRDHHAVEPEAYPEEEDLDNGAEVCDPSDKDDGSVIEVEISEPQNSVSMNESPTGADSAPVTQEDAPKLTYASILKVRSSIASTPVYVPINNVRVAPSDQQSFAPARPAPAPEASVPSSENAPDGGNVNNEAEGHSIYVRNLPFNATPAQLAEAFIKFGPIKRNGIQVRSNKQGFTFGFVEFEMSSSVHGALEDSPITIGDRQAHVEEKRTNTRVGTSAGGSGRGGRYSSGKGGFRTDSFRGRSGNYGGGRGYGRNNEFRNQGEFSGRPKVSSGRNTGNYQRANQDESGRSGGRQGGAKV